MTEAWTGMSKKSFGIKNFLFSFAIVCIVIYIFQHYNNSVDTETVELGSLEEAIPARGVVVKDETVYTATCDGNVIFHREEGERLNKGLLVADVNTDASASEINRQIAELNTAIELKKNPQVDEAIATNVPEHTDAKKYEADMQESILRGDYNSVYSMLDSIGNGSAVIYESGKYDGYTVDELEAMKSNLSRGLETNNIPYYSQRSGIISFMTDGLESMFSLDNADSIMPSDIRTSSYELTGSSADRAVESGDKLFKITENFSYYIAAAVSNDYIKLFTDGDEIKSDVRLKVNTGDTAFETWGEIRKINYGSEESVLIIYNNEFFYDIYDKRFVDVELIYRVHEGLLVSSSALTKRNGIDGVYVKDASNIIKFFPVDVLYKKNDVAIVSEGEYVSSTDRRCIEIYGSVEDTVKIFDRIVTEPERVYEGQIVD